MHPVHTFRVLPSLPDPLKPLERIARNLRWAWEHDAIELFRRLDDDLWKQTGQNPVRMLGMIDQRKLDVAAKDAGFVAHLDRVGRDLDAYLTERSTWFARTYGDKTDGLLTAYFSAEFGVTECLSIFAGGLGILAGDHLKASSDLAIPLVGMGLLYQQGYFRQYLNASGWQQESYEENDFDNLPLRLIPAKTVSIELPGRTVTARIWKAEVGRVSLYLLDTNIPENRPEDRDITDQLYGGDNEMRLKQEILLGIGGYRALVALGLRPTVYHMNEGHSAFLSIEHIRHLMATRGLSFLEARVIATSGLVFTTHTPVPAGHDYFAPDLMERYFGAYVQRLGISWQEFLGLGRQNPDNPGELFCMTVLALKLASFSNGVSKLHGKVSRKMWQSLWPGVPEKEIPIGHVTNGVHFRSWISFELNQLFDRYLGPKWREEPADATLWQRVDAIPAEELWRTHERRRERTVAYSRRRLREQLIARGAPPSEVDAAEEVLDPEALTIGFARRFATYKRATLLLRDLDRLSRILNNAQRPVQIIYAGKAHPRDDEGKQFIRQIVQTARLPELRRRVVFLEDYDMGVTRSLVQGVDVWLNTPRRPQEASGTSGMKALANGALNLSTLDGWWDEAWRAGDASGAHVGWAIGKGEDYQDWGYQDQVEGEALYNLLENDVVPAFYERRADGIPRRWVAMMRASLRELAKEYNMHRMVRAYAEEYYLIAHARKQTMALDGEARARKLAAWISRIRQFWPQVRVEAIENGLTELTVNTRVKIKARVRLGSLTPEDVHVELCLGRLDGRGVMIDPLAVPMAPTGSVSDAVYTFETQSAHANQSGLHGYTIRVLPYHQDLVHPFFPGMIAWPPSDVALTANA